METRHGASGSEGSLGKRTRQSDIIFEDLIDHVVALSDLIYTLQNTVGTLSEASNRQSRQIRKLRKEIEGADQVRNQTTPITDEAVRAMIPAKLCDIIRAAQSDNKEEDNDGANQPNQESIRRQTSMFEKNNHRKQSPDRSSFLQFTRDVTSRYFDSDKLLSKITNLASYNVIVASLATSMVNAFTSLGFDANVCTFARFKDEIKNCLSANRSRCREKNKKLIEDQADEDFD
jgi:hypothetical protein